MLSPLQKTACLAGVAALCGLLLIGFVMSRPGARSELRSDHVGAAGGSTPAPDERPTFNVGITGSGPGSAGLAAHLGGKAGATSLFEAEQLDVHFFDLKLRAAEILEKLDGDDLDVVLLSTDMAALAAATRPDLRAFFFAGWSRGNIGIIVDPKFKTIESLKDIRIAVTRATPTHFFLLKMLDDSSLTPEEVATIKHNLVFTHRSADAAHLFKRGAVQAAVVWEPELSDAIAHGRGTLLLSTAQATNLIGGVLVARERFLNRQAAFIPGFLRAWLGGAERLETDPGSSLPAIARFFGQTEEEAHEVLRKNAVADFPMNRTVFGLETEYAPFRILIENAVKIWQSEGVLRSGAVHHLEARTGFLGTFAHDYEDVPDADDTPPPAPMGPPRTVVKTRISVFFEPGRAVLDAQGRADIEQFARTIAKVYKNLQISVQGNTDSTGTAEFNGWLVRERAKAVIDELVRRHGIDPRRLEPIHNPPVPGGKNPAARRTEFFLRTTTE